MVPSLVVPLAGPKVESSAGWMVVMKAVKMAALKAALLVVQRADMSVAS